METGLVSVKSDSIALNTNNISILLLLVETYHLSRPTVQLDPRLEVVRRFCCCSSFAQAILLEANSARSFFPMANAYWA